MTEFLLVGSADELKPGDEPIVVEINRRWVAIYNIDGQFYAIEDRCTHDDGPLAEGTLKGCIVECPRHGARFDVRTGKVLSGPAGTVDVPTYQVKIENDQLWIGVKRA
ncbi:MAG: biphenyl 2,3-dioxygenase [Phototrophicales bacterium]|nr:MAG: biphenyl 2,3-dioxygenase [Phototrophicales bacterium]RMG71785.1 MAG: non-heme iron oxygenase ferredoxin subunit [Chloroflexota bacterium]